MTRTTVTASRRIAAVGVLLVLLALCSAASGGMGRPNHSREPTSGTSPGRLPTCSVTSIFGPRRGRRDLAAVPEDVPEDAGPDEGLLLPVRHRRVHEARRTSWATWPSKGDVSFAYTVFQHVPAAGRRAGEDGRRVAGHAARFHGRRGDGHRPRRGPVSAQTAAEARDRWRKRIKYDLLVLKADKDGRPTRARQGDRASSTRRYHSFAKRMHQTDSDELLEMYLNAVDHVVRSAHRATCRPSTLENFEIAMRLKLEGIGASLQVDDGYTVVKKIIPGGAADKDGQLKVDDKIVGVGQGDERRDRRRRRHEAQRRGQADPRQARARSSAWRSIPADSRERKIIEITREKIELKDSEAQGEGLRGRPASPTARRTRSA